MLSYTAIKHVIPVVFFTTLLGCASSDSDFAPKTLTLPDLKFAPEGIAISDDGTVYTGSLTQGRIISIDLNNQVTDLVPKGSNGLVSAIGMEVSTDNKLLYVCSSDGGFSALSGTVGPALLVFDRVSGESIDRYELPGGTGFCNDIAVLPNGVVLATDSFKPRIYSLAPEATELNVWLEDDQFAAEGFNLNGIAYDNQSQSVFVVRYNTGTFHRISIDDQGMAGKVTEVPLSKSINGPDGLTALGGGRFLLVEGGGLDADSMGNLLAITMNADGAEVELLASELKIPTTTAVYRDYAFVVEGQLDHLFNQETGEPDPFRIVPVQLPSHLR